MIIGVLVQLSNKNIDKVFDYSVPSELQDMIKIGIRVEVPFGKQVLEGFVLEIKSSSNLDVKDILSVKDEEVKRLKLTTKQARTPGTIKVNKPQGNKVAHKDIIL